MKSTCLVLLASVVLFLLGCSAQPSTDPLPSSEPVYTTDLNLYGLPPLPVDRQAAENNQTVLLGSEAYDYSDNAQIIDTTLQLNSDAESISWGIWRFSPENTLVSVEVDMTVPEENEAYICLADFSTGQWTIFGPFTETQTLPLSDEKHKSPLGNTYIAVVTANGSTATVNQLTLETASDWQITTVEEVGKRTVDYPDSLVQYTSLLDVQGNPAICYGVMAGGEIPSGVRYVRATDSSGADWGEPRSVASLENLSYVSAASLAEGQPAVYWIDGTYTGNPHFAYALDLAGDSWSEPEAIDTTQPDEGENGNYSYGTLCGGEGDPAVCYWDFWNNELRYSRRDMETSEWSTPESLVTAQAILPELVFGADGLPRVFYTDDTTNLFMTVGRNAENTGWTEAVALDDTPWNGGHASAEIVGSEIAVAYNYLTNGSVKFARYNSQSEQWDTQVADQTKYANLFISLAVIDGKPAVAYCAADDNILRYARALDAEGYVWGEGMDVDANGITGHYSSLAEINGRPAISYVNWDTGTLLFAIR